MMGLAPSSTLYCDKHSSFCVLVAFVFARQFLCKVSYALIISSLVLITGLIIL